MEEKTITRRSKMDRPLVYETYAYRNGSNLNEERDVIKVNTIMYTISDIKKLQLKANKYGIHDGVSILMGLIKSYQNDKKYIVARMIFNFDTKAYLRGDDFEGSQRSVI